MLADLAWKLHVATQVPTQLVGLAAACERRQSLGWCGPGSGPSDALGKGLAGGPGKGLAVVSQLSPARHLSGVSWVSLARVIAEGRRLLIFI